jgi:CRP/FNR family cyclic AMP-dependent transcriptional regulator
MLGPCGQGVPGGCWFTLMDARSALKRIPLFVDLSPAARESIALLARTTRYTDGQVIMLGGDPDAPVCFVLRGTVRVFRTNPDGREQTLIYLEAGSAFNMPAAFAKSRLAPASAMAVGPVELLTISQSDFRRIASETPEIALAVLGDLSEKLYHLTDLTYDLGLRSVRGRLARFLLTHLAQVEAQSATPIRWTHQEIATQIGTVREVVSRTLRAFAKEGLIKVERHRIVLLDSDALALEAES